MSSLCINIFSAPHAVIARTTVCRTTAQKTRYKVKLRGIPLFQLISSVSNVWIAYVYARF